MAVTVQHQPCCELSPLRQPQTVLLRVCVCVRFFMCQVCVNRQCAATGTPYDQEERWILFSFQNHPQRVVIGTQQDHQEERSIKPSAGLLSSLSPPLQYISKDRHILVQISQQVLILPPSVALTPNKRPKHHPLWQTLLPPT